ncbi:TRAP transporter permease [Pararhodobacter sp.]|uniref:TRAP transporter permease n=1 Tax=Pararhodobacter sp. TaxID=2127056 RepID=UPI002FDDD7A5
MNFATLRTGAGYLAGLIAVAIALQAIYVSYQGAFDIAFTRAGLLWAGIVVALLCTPLADRVSGGPRMRALAWALDLAMIVLLTVVMWRFITVLGLLERTIYMFTRMDVMLALAGIAILLETTRRLFGLPIVIISVVGLVFCFIGPWLPGFLNHSGMRMDRVMLTVWYSFQGVFGIPLGIVIQMVLIFIVFGAVLEGTGASNALIRVSLALTGRTRGGPAHSAVIASGFFGAMSGSVTANVVGTGSFTIPMIQRRGFKPAMAGGIEAAASTGGQIVPPVMGAAAFLMADLIGVPYATVAIAAIIPALLFYGALFTAISIQAAKQNIQPVPLSERLPLTRRDLLASLLFLIPIAAIVAVLVMGRSPAMAGFVATLTAAVLGLFNPANWKDPWLVWKVLVQAGRNCASILVAVGCIGVILGVLNLTGLGLSFASAVSGLSEHSLLGSLIVTALACLMLGMGMPTLPAYLIIVLVLGPVLTRLGADQLAAHMFVFYFGVLSAITPPVAIGAFAAAPIAKANPMETSVMALKLALTGFLIPFVFVYEPILLLIGPFDPVVLVRVIVSLSLAIWMLNTGLIGFAGNRLGWPERGLRLGVAALLLIQIPQLQLVMIAVSLAVILGKTLALRRARAQAQA